MILLKSACLSVVVRKLQAAILARSSREMSLTVCIDCHSFFSRVRISVRPSKFFIGKKHPKTIAKSELPRECSVSNKMNGDNCSHSDDRVSQNSEKATSQNGDNESL